MKQCRRVWLVAGIVALLTCGAYLLHERSRVAYAATAVQYPREDVAAQLAARKEKQLKTAADFQVFYKFQFTDQLEQSGITFVHHIVDDAGKDYKAVHYDHGNGIAVADVDGDGLYDIYFVNQAGGNELWKNLGHGHFTDITKSAGVGLVAHSSGAVFFDYNNDGLLDLLVCNVGQYTNDQKGAQGQYVGLADAFSGHMFPDRYEFPVLYRNMGHNQFKDMTMETGLKPVGWAGDASFADLNGDGLPDVYVLNMMGANHYFENHGGTKFSDETKRYFPKTSWGAMGIKFFDYDNDGRMDLFVTDMHSDMFGGLNPDEEKDKAHTHPADSFLMGPADSFVFGNSLYHNLGEGKFAEVSDSMGVENYWPWGPSVGDLNADGWDDIFIASSMNFPFRYGINSLLLNNKGKKFLDSEFLLGVEPRRGGRTHTTWYDVDCDQAAAHPRSTPYAPCAGQSGRITVMAPLGSRAAAIFDLDNDGDLDIVTNDFNSAPQILVSNLAQQRAIHWLKVKLIGSSSNRDGLGATVRVAAAGQTYTKYSDGKSGYLSQSSLPLYFGLGDADKIDRVEVNWPSGKKQTVSENLRTNTVLDIREPR